MVGSRAGETDPAKMLRMAAGPEGENPKMRLCGSVRDPRADDGQTGSYSGFRETQAGHSQFDAYAPIKRHFRMVSAA